MNAHLEFETISFPDYVDQAYDGAIPLERFATVGAFREAIRESGMDFATYETDDGNHVDWTGEHWFAFDAAVKRDITGRHVKAVNAECQSIARCNGFRDWGTMINTENSLDCSPYIYFNVVFESD